MSKNLRLCFVGDSLLLGTNDDLYLGWPGRLCQREREAGHFLSYYNLGIRGDTSEQIAARWRHEAMVRLPDFAENALVFSFGVNDTADMDGVGRRVPLARSVAVARGMLAQAQAWLPTLWIGPPPVDDGRQPFRAGPGVTYHFKTDRVAACNDAYRQIAAELGIPYCDVFAELVDDPDWPGVYADADGVHPTAPGYGRIAGIVAAWEPWRAWFD